MQKQKQDKKQRIKQLSGTLVSLQLLGILINYTKNTIGIFNLEHAFRSTVNYMDFFCLNAVKQFIYLFIYSFIYPLLTWYVQLLIINLTC